jgi:hypothetical protein
MAETLSSRAVLASPLEEQVAEMRRLSSLPDAQLFATCGVSRWTPSEHLDHTVKVMSSIVGRLLQRVAERGRPLSPLGHLILLVRWIPRGRGKSPERLRGARASREELSAALDRVAKQLARIETSHLERARGRIVPHPRFGGLTPPQAMRFAAIHTQHHLKIVADMLRQATAS